jgi:hypothetical protein
MTFTAGMNLMPLWRNQILELAKLVNSTYIRIDHVHKVREHIDNMLFVLISNTDEKLPVQNPPPAYSAELAAAILQQRSGNDNGNSNGRDQGSFSRADGSRGRGSAHSEVEVAEAMGAVVAEEVFEVVVVKGLRQQEDGERTDSRMHSLLSTMTTKKEPRRR